MNTSFNHVNQIPYTNVIIHFKKWLTVFKEVNITRMTLFILYHLLLAKQTQKSTIIKTQCRF